MEFGVGESFNFGSGFFTNLSYTDRVMKEEEEDEDDQMGVCTDDDDDDDDSSSSVGSRSDSTDDEVACKDMETEDAFQQVLPVRKGISKFYSGKSKSFTSLADAVSSASIKELAKPEPLHSRKQNDLLARKIPNSNQVNSSRTNPGGTFRKFAPSNEFCSSSVSPPFRLPPLHPQRKKMQNPVSSDSPTQLNCSPWRSFSVSDLQSMVHNA